MILVQLAATGKLNTKVLCYVFVRVDGAEWVILIELVGVIEGRSYLW